MIIIAGSAGDISILRLVQYCKGNDNDIAWFNDNPTSRDLCTLNCVGIPKRDVVMFNDEHGAGILERRTQGYPDRMYISQRLSISSESCG